MPSAWNDVRTLLLHVLDFTNCKFQDGGEFLRILLGLDRKTFCFLDAREQVRLLKHNELREAVSNNDLTRVRVLLDALGPEREIIVNMAPAGANTLLFIAAQSGFDRQVLLLIDAGSDGRAHAVTKYSPLYTAVHHGHERVVKILLDKFPELVQQLTVERWLPFHAACINGLISIVELLTKHTYPEHLLSTYSDPSGTWEWRLAFDPNIQDVTKQTALYVSCLLGNKPLLETLLNWRVRAEKVVDDPTSPTAPLISPSRRIASGIQSIMFRLSLSSSGEPVDKEHYRNPIDLNVLCGQARETALLASVRGGFMDVTELLLDNGADPNISAKPIEDQNDPKSYGEEIYGFSMIPLAEAVRQKSIKMVELLLKHGAKDDQSTALGIAAENNDEPIMCLLLAIKSHQDPDYKINNKASAISTLAYR